MKSIIDTLMELFTSLFEGLESLFEKDHSVNATFGNPSTL